MTEPMDIMLIAGCAHGRVQPEDEDLIAFGRALQESVGGAMGVWVVGDAIESVAADMARRYGLVVTALRGDGLSAYLNETHTAVLVEEIAAVKPRYVCTPHTSRGWDWAPAAAAHLGAGCITGVDGLVVSGGRLCFQRDLYGGKVKGLFASNAATTVITVQPGIFKLERKPAPMPGKVIHKSWKGRARRTRHCGSRQAAADTIDITTAPIIIAAGNGIGDEDNMALVHRLARLLPKAAVAGSRMVCDRGWLGYSHQVGVTGATVSPALYIACGISGASQHVVGMRGAGFVVAVNTDPRAPIFNEADIGIVEDVVSFIPLVEAACAKLTAISDQSSTLKNEGEG